MVRCQRSPAPSPVTTPSLSAAVTLGHSQAFAPTLSPPSSCSFFLQSFPSSLTEFTRPQYLTQLYYLLKEPSPAPLYFSLITCDMAMISDRSALYLIHTISHVREEALRGPEW